MSKLLTALLMIFAGVALLAFAAWTAIIALAGVVLRLFYVGFFS